MSDNKRILYHGTLECFSILTPQDTDSFLGRGIYLTDSRVDAEKYASLDVGINPDLISKTDMIAKSSGMSRESIREIQTANSGTIHTVQVSLNFPLIVSNKGITFNNRAIDFNDIDITRSFIIDGHDSDTIKLMAEHIDRIIDGDTVLRYNLVGDKDASTSVTIMALLQKNHATRALREIAVTLHADSIVLEDGCAPRCDGATHYVMFHSEQIEQVKSEPYMENHNESMSIDL